MRFRARPAHVALHVCLWTVPGCMAMADWAVQFGDSGVDQVYGLVTDRAGALFSAGYTKTSVYGQPSSGEDAFVVKHDATGALVWARQFGFSGFDYASSLARMGDEAVVVGGQTNGNFTGTLEGGSGDAFVRVYEGTGAVRWTTQFGSTNPDWVNAVAVDSLGFVYVAGETRGTLPGQTALGGGDAFLAKLDGASGAVLWRRQLGTTAGDKIKALGIDGAGNIFAGGATEGTLLGQAASAGSGDAFVMKLDGTGVTLWTRQFGSEYYDDVQGLGVDSAGAVIVGGGAGAALPGQASAGEADAFVLKLDQTGAEVWTRQFGTSDPDFVTSVAVDTLGRAILGVISTGSGSTIQTWDTAGALVETQAFGTSTAEAIYAVAVDDAGLCYGGGYTFPQVGTWDAYVVQVVPEPQSATLLLTGGLGWLGRRRRAAGRQGAGDELPG